MVRITAEERELLSPYIFSLSGIFFDKSKEYLLQSRLASLLVKWRCGSFTELYKKAVSEEKVKNGGAGYPLKSGVPPALPGRSLCSPESAKRPKCLTNPLPK